MASELFIVSTPIGNLQDMTVRAIETLKKVDFIVCEDTRVTHTLLKHFEISTPTLSYHHHSPHKRVQEITTLLEEGKNVALVTDAGTPGISDPGNQLVAHLGRQGIRITPVPGPSALVAALSVCGFSTDRFTFFGFPPHKNKRRQFFQTVADTEHTAAFFESPYRIHKAIHGLANLFESTPQICVCRELTKTFETIYRGTAAKIQEMEIPAKGEFVLVCEGKRT